MTGQQTTHTKQSIGERTSCFAVAIFDLEQQVLHLTKEYAVDDLGAVRNALGALCVDDIDHIITVEDLCADALVIHQLVVESIMFLNG